MHRHWESWRYDDPFLFGAVKGIAAHVVLFFYVNVMVSASVVLAAVGYRLI